MPGRAQGGPASDYDTPRGQRPSLDALGGRTDAEGLYNQIPQHPPGYTILLAIPSGVIDRVWPGQQPWDQDLALLRFLTVPLLGLTVLLCAEAGRAARLSRSGIVLCATAPLMVPQVVWLAGMVNNDNLLMAAMAAVTVYCLRIGAGDLSRGVAVGAGVALGIALFAKPFALVGPLWILGAYALAARSSLERAARMLPLTAAVSFVAGGFWYALNLVRFGTPTPSRSSLPRQPDFEPDLGVFLDRYVPGMRHSFFGQFGWNELQLWRPYVVWVGWLLLACMVLVGFGQLRRLLWLWAPVLSAVTLAFVFAYRGHARTGLYPAIQGRYLFGAIAAAAVLCAAGATGMITNLRSQRWLPVAALAVAAIGQIAAVQVMMQRWYGPEGGSFVKQVAALIDWSPWPLGFQVVVIAAVAASVAWTLRSLATFVHDEGEAHPRNGTADQRAMLENR